MWGPQTIAKLVKKSPMNTIVISTINHSYWSYVHQLSYLGDPTLQDKISSTNSVWENEIRDGDGCIIHVSTCAYWFSSSSLGWPFYETTNFHGKRRSMISTMWGPQTIAKLVNKSPMNTIVISTINHSYWSYVHQLSDFVNGGPMISRWLCLNRLHPSVGESTCSLHVLPKNFARESEVEYPMFGHKDSYGCIPIAGPGYDIHTSPWFFDGPFIEIDEKWWIFPWRTVSHNQMVYTVPIKIPGDVPLFIVNSLFLWLLGIPSRIEKAGNSWGFILGETLQKWLIQGILLHETSWNIMKPCFLPHDLPQIDRNFPQLHFQMKWKVPESCGCLRPGRRT